VKSNSTRFPFTLSKRFLALLSRIYSRLSLRLHVKEVLILTPSSSLYFATWIKSELAKQGIATRVQQRLKFHHSPRRGVVLAPQAFRRLPEKFIAVQVEQLASSRGFDLQLRSVLESSDEIFDFSTANIGVLKDHFDANKIHVLQPSPMDLIDSRYAEFECRDIEVLFYGWTASKRRREALDTLAREFAVEVVEGTYESELANLISRSRCVINVHFYEDSILETIRLSESMSYGTPVISEDARDRADFPYAHLVEFVPLGDWDRLLDSVLDIVRNGERWNNRHQAICKAINDQHRSTDAIDHLARAIRSIGSNK
jgi:hypothetical protein